MKGREEQKKRLEELELEVWIYDKLAEINK